VKIESLKGKCEADLNISTVSLSSVVPGSSPEDNITNGDVLVILDETKAYKNKRFNDAVFVIVGTDGKPDEGKQLYLSTFSRSAVPYTKDAEGMVVRDMSGETVLTGGTVIKDWQESVNANEFFTKFKGKKFKVTLAATVSVRKWDRNLNDFSSHDLREQKIYNFDWV
jgi:hypothetical protein